MGNWERPHPLNHVNSKILCELILTVRGKRHNWLYEIIVIIFEVIGYIFVAQKKLDKIDDKFIVHEETNMI